MQMSAGSLHHGFGHFAQNAASRLTWAPGPPANTRLMPAPSMSSTPQPPKPAAKDLGLIDDALRAQGLGLLKRRQMLWHIGRDS